ncbi:hypothetical protein ACJIZ3_011742 [Penstemon smallii]|uniref:Uncharacterized protein n=1 Tax=Penstemon smallii TaxID=265156 RepID=A0ABD3UKE0_9LAMI
MPSNPSTIITKFKNKNLPFFPTYKIIKSFKLP